MVEKSDQIERHIESTRNELGSNLQELEHKVKQATDWKTYFERNPMTMIGVAFGGGVLLAAMMDHEDGGRARRIDSPLSESRPQMERSPKQPNEAWDTLKGTVIGMMAQKARDVLNDALPGFNDHYEKVRRERSQNPAPIGRHIEPSAYRS